MGSHYNVSWVFVGIVQGYAPYNPRKRNQDAIIMHEHAATGTVLLGVLDGHGEAGDLVSHFVSERIAPRVFRHPEFTTDPGRAIAEELDRLERTMLADSAIDTEFSGSTAVLAAVRDRKIHACNVGDSRIIVAREIGGKLTAVDVSIDHKPDLAEEKRRIEVSHPLAASLGCVFYDSRLQCVVCCDVYWSTLGVHSGRCVPFRQLN